MHYEPVLLLLEARIVFPFCGLLAMCDQIKKSYCECYYIFMYISILVKNIYVDQVSSELCERNLGKYCALMPILYCTRFISHSEDLLKR